MNINYVDADGDDDDEGYSWREKIYKVKKKTEISGYLKYCHFKY